MEIVHTQKFLRISPKKLRPVVELIKKRSLEEAISILPYVDKKGAGLLQKILTTTLANVRDRKIEDKIVIKEIEINEGPKLKRGRPVSRGRWHPFVKRMSHVRVVLTTQKNQVPKSKKEMEIKNKSQTKNTKKEKLSNAKISKNEKQKKGGKSKI